jgi:acetoin utilization deacetylase AcuC-like enzyme
LLDGGESCGFCIFNNVAAGALYAIEEDSLMCERCAIVDIDVHHGNGTEEIVRKCHDPSKLFFFSIHLYDNDKRKRINPNQVVYKFYPGTGMEDDLALNIINVPIVPLWKDCLANAPRTHNTRMKARSNDPTSSVTVVQDDSSDTSSRNNTSTDNGGTSTPTTSTLSGRLAYREAIRSRLLPALRAFNPDLILISAGFDALKYDVGNARHEGVGREKMGLDLEPEDYAWTTRKILQIADICCQGRVVSILEGGYGRTPVPKMNNNNTNNSNSNRSPDGSNNNNNNNQDVTNLDRTLFGECAVRHLQAMIDPYDTENRFTSYGDE